MKTATVTWTTYNNYGTLLQAYALQQKLLQLGHQNEILCDDKILKAFQLQRKKASPSGVRKPAVPTPTKYSALRRAAHVLTSPAKAERVLLARTNREKYERPYYESQKACDRFRNEELNIYRDVDPEKPETLNERYDAFIAGSDQIWSVFENIFNPYYYLDFAAKRKIAYAPCMGTDQIPKALEPELRELLADYYALSAREDISAKRLSELTGQRVEWVADPTLLLTAKQWAESVRHVTVPVKKKYLLCYFLENRPWYFEQTEFLAHKLHLRPVLIPNQWDYISSEYVLDGAVGPKEFVALFQNADYVLTDSYHGSIFSMLFNKGFQYLMRFEENDPKSQNIRLHSLFHYFDLDGISVSPENQFTLPGNTDKAAIQERIRRLRNDSIRYLENSLA